MKYFSTFSRIVAACLVAGIILAPAAYSRTAHTLWLDSARAYPGDHVFYNVNLANDDPVGSFNLLVKYDASAVWPVNLTNEGTRAADFEYFDYTYDEYGTPGNVRIVGMSSLSGGTPSLTTTLPPGGGSVARFTFVVANSIDLAGLYIPMRFIFLDSPTNDDNTLTDGSGVKIEQSQIDYYDGWIAVREMGEVNVGDINLNGFTYEVSDYVYFSNYFMNPTGHPMNALQMANSDMNGDFIEGSIADLVTLINRIMQGVKAPGPAATNGPEALVATERRGDAAIVSYETDFEVGGVYLALRTSEPVNPRSIVALNDNMDIQVAATDTEVRLFVYSMSGERLPSGGHDLVSIAGPSELRIESVDLADADGHTAAVRFAPGSAQLPAGFALDQNYPNPFNPVTHIEFDLAAPSDVRLTVYDLLGREVTTLLDARCESGRHGVEWNGRDADGRAVASGVYLYRLETESGALSRKMILMK